MSHSKKTHELIRQNEQIVKKSQKHEANLQKNTTLYFQIGLIVCLLSAYGLLEMKFETEIPKDFGEVYCDVGVEEIAIENIKVYEEKVAPKVEQKQVEILTKEPDIVDEIPEFIKPKEVVTAEQNTGAKEDLKPGVLVLEKAPDEDAPVDFIRVEQVPIYPGCEKEKDNEGRKKCMSDKLSKLIQRKFDTELGNELGLSGKQVIRTRFTIDKNGRVKDVKIRAPHSKLENEAERVIDFIPEMIPGKQRDKNVDVIYDLPIVFKVQY
ncbi:energy transducer TonB [Aestuariibaculum sediminum]|uniref:Energy transducer TonB n=1 Tax=Aestuariibaculum sediminum TaxID=2770637 RepID=A0A8J6U9P6_9FLAO|nr:energy transducer TonB [Aestuariibaculum sediminum]MBD0833477.1 energy transducer TonB [Aestuariibaculum sediminum]